MRGNPRARKLVYGKHLIVYTINEPRRYVAVLRFLHGAQIK
jgi:plasmid stabilization system protein ParE